MSVLVLKKGMMNNSNVKLLQKLLGLESDGNFTISLENEVKKYQKEHGLSVDGIVGENTWKSLINSSVFQLKKSKRKINEIILHCSATPEGENYTVKDIRDWHLQRGFEDIGYHYVVYIDGSVHLGRDVDKQGAHTKGHNQNTIGICYIGGCDKRQKGWEQMGKDTRTPKQKEMLLRLVSELVLLYGLDIENIKGHYEYTNKNCPAFDMVKFRKDLKDYIGR